MLENNRKEEMLKKHLTKKMDSIKVPKGLKEEMWTQVEPVRKKKKVLPYIVALACLAILVPLGLIGIPLDSDPMPSDVVTTQEENIRSIEAVLQNALTGPSDEFKKVFNSEELIDLVKHEEELYKDYFADDMAYLDFVMNNGSRIMIEAARNDYKLKVKNIEYEKTESEEIIYNFTVELQYQQVGRESSGVESVTGQANLNEEHKIEDILIRDGDFYNLIIN
ncbi:hypothetical protein [Oceanobacillus sp. CF4.6]|uniref:hypothetical protein n=1 Tax=Oceanobacillus sp. CF4.6 TaxID=3373080 RepID=UPI003EE63076